ncbi:hypothetical protein LguiB_028566 [Lonicera macranthoides]
MRIKIVRMAIELCVRFKSKITENTLLMMIASYEEILSKLYLSKGETAVSDFGRQGASPPPPPKPAPPEHELRRCIFNARTTTTERFYPPYSSPLIRNLIQELSLTDLLFFDIVVDSVVRTTIKRATRS